MADQLLTVALNPKTGAILAMASYPSFDPNVLAIHDGTQLNKNDNQLLADQAQPLVNRALQGTYPPGSTFKIVTSSVLLQTQNPGTTSSTPTSTCSTQLTLPQDQRRADQSDLGGIRGDGSGQAPLITAFAQSCDTTFAKIGMNVGVLVLNRLRPLRQPRYRRRRHNSRRRLRRYRGRTHRCAGHQSVLQHPEESVSDYLLACCCPTPFSRTSPGGYGRALEWLI